ncbi:peptidyl-tRNA hydrolase [Megasphaera cerevisiae DSM 20462]|jgi:PTH1 family peptidyl-tRNA hydrolase|uniref:Peptidyl-tRNA hydrolase n=1 Tax=Megasphaera cerevisiae DSM 20462 TaxID=1122219 RepID=A0A0J6WW65_9FIRM|nr:aminoacyl-tRNA hydrolase [Megasphaera cerevisiae]KMO86027.1 peptidyl-tRNA hydrolase [Megasphaera cerevisiae DSM 20462]OKY54615.1 aminoacyl-tRNA hydrolase [Megasphaera cerevisiae]
MIVGLGNPGHEYEKSKHNTGFRVIDNLAARWKITTWQHKMDAEIAQTMIDGEKIILVKPQTYMNNSGQSVGPLMRWYKVEQSDVYVIYDDMDLAVGRIRIRKSGSDGGHNGIKSLLANGCTDFIRFRVGIGRPLPHHDVVDHVLTPFPDELIQPYAEGLEAAAIAVEGCLELGVDKGMNRYNPKKKKKAE